MLVPPIDFAPRGLVCFDFDCVLSPKEVINELAILANAKQKVNEITDLAMNGSINYKLALHKRISLLKGLNAGRLVEVGEKLQLTAGAREVIDFLLSRKILPAIISGGFKEVISVANKRLGVPLILANTLEIREGLLTGKFHGYCTTIDAKGELIALIVEKFRIPKNKTAAICDGANDVSLLKKVALPIGFRPKKGIKKNIKYHSFNDMREILGYLLIEGFFE